jgi:aspartokinase-like uncharacterized kinase
LIVVKVGGSLFDLPDLGARLEAWLSAQPGGRFVLVTGGGAAADVVREMDKVHGLGDKVSHGLALHAVSLMTSLLLALAPRSLRLFRLGVVDLEAPQEAHQSICVQDLNDFARWDEGRPGCLPLCWDVTSDSLSARLAEVLGAYELILLKSVIIPRDMEWAEASRRGYVDRYFPTVVGRGVSARAINLRQWQP